MAAMSRIDPLELDGRLLQLLVAVDDEGSITRAAEQLGVTQSAVSHGLDRLRAIVGDALVVKSGRGIAVTPHGHALAERARGLVAALRGFADGAAFDPATLELTVTIAANPLQRDLLLPAAFARLRAAAPGVRLRVIPSDVPSGELLRDDRCQLAISPRPPDAADVVQKRLFDDGYRVFYDASQRDAPPDRAAYEAAEHVSVCYPTRGPLEIDRWMAQQGVRRRLSVQVSDFSGLAPFVRGTARIATMPSLLRIHQLAGLADAAVPLDCPPMPMYLLWHRRHQADPVHAWLRGAVEAAAATLV